MNPLPSNADAEAAAAWRMRRARDEAWDDDRVALEARGLIAGMRAHGWVHDPVRDWRPQRARRSADPAVVEAAAAAARAAIRANRPTPEAGEAPPQPPAAPYAAEHGPPVPEGTPDPHDPATARNGQDGHTP